jgi:hypothetical protein
MGRTVPTFVQLIQEAAERWKKFRRALRREDQPHFDRLFVRVRCYTQAATYQAHDNPMEAEALLDTGFGPRKSYVFGQARKLPLAIPLLIEQLRR